MRGLWCDEETEGNDCEHPECELRAAVGGIGHVLDHERHCVRRHDPDMGLSYRESARRVLAWVHGHGVGAAVAVAVTPGLVAPAARRAGLVVLPKVAEA